MNDHDILADIFSKVTALHQDWFGNGQEGYRAKIVRHDEQIDQLRVEVDAAATRATKKAALTGMASAVVAAITAIFAKDKVL